MAKKILVITSAFLLLLSAYTSAAFACVETQSLPDEPVTACSSSGTQVVKRYYNCKDCCHWSDCYGRPAGCYSTCGGSCWGCRPGCGGSTVGGGCTPAFCAWHKEYLGQYTVACTPPVTSTTEVEVMRVRYDNATHAIAGVKVTGTRTAGKMYVTKSDGVYEVMTLPLTSTDSKKSKARTKLSSGESVALKCLNANCA